MNKKWSCFDFTHVGRLNRLCQLRNCFEKYKKLSKKSKVHIVTDLHPANFLKKQIFIPYGCFVPDENNLN